MEIAAAPHWQTVDFVSDLHLQAQEPENLSALARYLEQTPAQAVFILGDLFEVWVGDDALQSGTGFERSVAEVLRRASQHIQFFIMRGNRDFLMGDKLMAACGAHALEDPSVLVAGNVRWLLTHGDALCLADVPYQAFRKEARSISWQKKFLDQALAQRLEMASQMRAESEAQKQQRAKDHAPWIDLDRGACLALLAQYGADHMIHGHTHQPAEHALGGDHQRWVLSDWDVCANPPRAQALRLTVAEGSVQRVALSGTSLPNSAPL